MWKKASPEINVVARNCSCVCYAMAGIFVRHTHHAHMKHHAMLCQRRAHINRQTGKQARKLPKKREGANRQPRSFDEKKCSKREKTHAQIFKFIYFIIRLSW